MTEQIDKPPSGSGKPTLDEIAQTRDYLLRNHRSYGIGPVTDELVANGFEIGRATVARYLSGKVPAAEHVARVVRSSVKPANLGGLLVKDAVKALADIIGPKDNLKKRHEIALLENKVRMGLNIILMEHMIARPELLLLDMRGTAALIDALTVSAELSGSNAFEVIRPGEHPEMNGDGMKDITPQPRNATQISIEEFRRSRNGKGA